MPETTPRPGSDPMEARCTACLAPPGEPCLGTTSDLPRERVHRLRPLAAAPRLVRCRDCGGSGWRDTAPLLSPEVTCPVCGAAPGVMCTEGGAERRHLHVVRVRAARAGVEPCPSCDAVGWIPEPTAPHLDDARARVLAELFGTPEPTAESGLPVDAVRLCSTARPGEHEREVRERVAAEQRAAAQAIIDSSGEDDDPLTDEVWSRCTQSQDAPATLEDPRTIAIVAYEWFAARLTATCTTPCDAECVELCHEVHEVDWKRVHSPQDCQSARIARGES